MSYLWRPRFVVGNLDYTFTLPMRPPRLVESGIGGSEESATGLPASYEVREDPMLEVRLRFLEEDWPDVRELIREMQTHFTTIAFYPDADDASVANTCYLRSPARGDEWSPERSEEMASRGLDLTIRLRSITGAWDIRYFAEDDE